MAPHNKPVTLSDLESHGSTLTADAGSLRCAVPGSNTTWSLNVGLWVALVVVANLVHPPAIIMLALNAAFLLFNLEACRKAGRANTPTWIFVVIACQALVTLQYGWSSLATMLR